MGQDFSLTGVQGRDFGEMTVGIIGTGAIGCALAKHLSGFGCRILACGHHANPDLPASAEYVELQKVLQESDILSLHIPSNRENYHFMDRERISRMKKDAVLINTARGDLVDTDALIDALEEGRLSGAGLDVIEGDREIYYRDHKDKQLCHRQKAILEAMPNVILLPHIGFCTRRAVSDMIQNSVKNCIEYLAEHPA